MSVSDRAVTFSDSVWFPGRTCGSGGTPVGLMGGESLCHGSDGQAGIDADIGGNTCPGGCNTAVIASELVLTTWPRVVDTPGRLP